MVQFIPAFSYVLSSRAMTQVVSLLPLTTEARVRPCGICGPHSGTGTSVYPSYSAFLYQYN
jgi:hypothetical protein